MELRKFISTAIYEYLNEQKVFDKKYDAKIRCIYLNLQKEFKKYYELSGGKDGLWVDIAQELRRIRGYFEDGYFLAGRDGEENKMTDFLKNLDYSNSHTYKKGEKIGILSDTNTEIPVYEAIGNKTLFRGVSLMDWNRIKKQGFLDSDMRGAIVETEGINLAQKPTTARYYLPNNDMGVILAISPKNLDLYMLDDEYIRVFEPIPIKNIIKVSDVYITKHGAILTQNTKEKIDDIINRLKKINININC